MNKIEVPKEAQDDALSNGTSDSHQTPKKTYRTKYGADGGIFCL
jgi:hypothetical protein